jgi:alpha-N-arabinofuranosidase
LVAATTLDIFNRHADKVVMANIAQTVNVLQAMVLTQEDKMLITPTGYVYEMYVPHQGAQSVRTIIETDMASFRMGDREESLPVVAGSASLKGDVLSITLTNSHAERETPVTVQLVGGSQATGGTAQVLAGELHAHNTFDDPEQVAPKPLTLDALGMSFEVNMPPASVVAAQIQLA